MLTSFESWQSANGPCSLQAFKQEVHANKSAILREIQANSLAMTTLNQDIDTLDEARDDASWRFQQEVHSNNSIMLRVLKINSSAITTLNQEVHTLSEAIDAASWLEAVFGGSLPAIFRVAATAAGNISVLKHNLLIYCRSKQTAHTYI